MSEELADWSSLQMDLEIELAREPCDTNFGPED